MKFAGIAHHNQRHESLKYFSSAAIHFKYNERRANEKTSVLSSYSPFSEKIEITRKNPRMKIVTMLGTMQRRGLQEIMVDEHHSPPTQPGNPHSRTRTENLCNRNRKGEAEPERDAKQTRQSLFRVFPNNPNHNVVTRWLPARKWHMCHGLSTLFRFDPPSCSRVTDFSTFSSDLSFFNIKCWHTRSIREHWRICS